MLNFSARLIRLATVGAILLVASLSTEARGDMSVSAADLESFLSLPPDTLLGVGNGPVNSGSGLWSSFSVNTGDVLSFQYNFLTNEVVDAGNTINDFAFFTVGGNAIPVADVISLPLTASVSGFASETGFQNFSYTFNQTGSVVFGIGVVNVTDDEFDSAMLIDNLQLNSILTSNGSFETGDLSGFNSIGDARVVGSFGASPPNGTFQGLITTGSGAVPEPSSFALLGIGATAMLWRARWRTKRSRRDS